MPAPEGDAYARQQYEAPQGEIECALAQIWQQLLRVDRISRHDNFFELGGHSLLIVQLITRLQGLGLQLEVRRVFESPVLADLAATVRRVVTAEYEVPPRWSSASCSSPNADPLIGTLSAFGTYAVGFAARPLGGIVFGHYGDRIGRKSMLVLSLLIMGRRDVPDRLPADLRDDRRRRAGPARRCCASRRASASAASGAARC